MNEHLLPELIVNLVDQFNKATRENEFYSLQQRLEAIRSFVDSALQKKKELPRKGPFRSGK